MNFTQEQIEDYNTGFKEGFEAGNNMLSIGATNIDDIRNFLPDKGKGVFYKYGYLKGYFIGHKDIKNQKINITSKGNFDINTLTPDDIKELIENKMENKSDDKLKKKLYNKYVEITEHKNRQNKRSLPEEEEEEEEKKVEYDNDDYLLNSMEFDMTSKKEREFIEAEERKQNKSKRRRNGSKGGRKSKKRHRRTKKSKK